MKSTRWVITYILMASVGLWFAFFMSLRFMAPAHSQTPPPPTAGDIPPEFMEDAANPPPTGRIPPPPAGTPTAAPQQPPGNAVPPQGNPPAQGGAQPVPPASPNQGQQNLEQGSVPVNPEFAVDEQYNYDPAGRRDPFKPYRNYRPAPVGPGGAVNRADLSDPLQRWDVNRFIVMAIIWEVKNPKAMIKDPDGATYMVTKNTKIGRNAGYVVAIREGEVVVVETIDNEGVTTKEVRILELKK